MKTTRTVITISDQEKQWLAGYTQRHGISMAEAVRRGIACLKTIDGQRSYRELIHDTSGIWTKGDGLRYQEQIRAEWEEP